MGVEVLVRCRPVSSDPALAELLDESERARASRRSSPARYVTAHALLRTTVAEWTGLPPTRVAFERTCASCGSQSHGKPRVTGHPGVFVSLSYAGRLAVVALTTAGEAGVDVEEVAESDFDGFTEVTLAPSEVPALQSLPPELLRTARARVWARKEAVLKASGHGLAVDPREVVVSGPQQPAALLAWHGERPLPAPVQLADVPWEDGEHVAAVAVLVDQPLDLRVVSG